MHGIILYMITWRYHVASDGIYYASYDIIIIWYHTYHIMQWYVWHHNIYYDHIIAYGDIIIVSYEMLLLHACMKFDYYMYDITRWYSYLWYHVMIIIFMIAYTSMHDNIPYVITWWYTDHMMYDIMISYFSWYHCMIQYL